MRSSRWGVLSLAGALLMIVGGGCASAPHSDDVVIVVPVPVPVFYPDPVPYPDPAPQPDPAPDPQPPLTVEAPRHVPIDRPRGDTAVVTKIHESPSTPATDPPRTKPVSDDRRPDRSDPTDRDRDRNGSSGGTRTR